MKIEMLIQNVFTLLILGIIIEASIMAIFSMTFMKELDESRPVEIARDVMILFLSLALCYKVDLFTLFGGTGVKLPRLMDAVISGLVLTRMANLFKDFFGRIRMK